MCFHQKIKLKLMVLFLPYVLSSCFALYLVASPLPRIFTVIFNSSLFLTCGFPLLDLLYSFLLIFPSIYLLYFLMAPLECLPVSIFTLYSTLYGQRHLYKPQLSSRQYGTAPQTATHGIIAAKIFTNSL